MPYFPASWLAKKDPGSNGGLYEALILALLKLWMSISDIKDDNHSFWIAFDVFLSTTSDKNQKTIENMDFFHKLSKRASANITFTDNDTWNGQADVITTENTTTGDTENVSQIDNMTCFVTEDIIAEAIDRLFSSHELRYADDAIRVRNAAGAFAVEAVATLPPQQPLPATTEQCSQFTV